MYMVQITLQEKKSSINNADLQDQRSLLFHFYLFFTPKNLVGIQKHIVFLVFFFFYGIDLPTWLLQKRQHPKTRSLSKIRWDLELSISYLQILGQNLLNISFSLFFFCWWGEDVGVETEYQEINIYIYHIYVHTHIRYASVFVFQANKKGFFFFVYLV